MAHLRKSAMREYAESIGMAVAVALVLRAFVVEAFIIPSASMDPTLLEGDRLFVNKGAYGVRLPFTTTRVVDFSQPERGDVVVFVFPREEARAHVETLPPMRRGCVDPASLREEKDYIKRVVAVAGDRVRIEGEEVLVNGERLVRAPLPSHRYVEEGEGGPDPDEAPDVFRDATAFEERSRAGEQRYTVLYDRATLLRTVDEAGFDVVEWLPWGAFPAYFYLFAGAAFMVRRGRGLELDKMVAPYFAGQVLTTPIRLFEKQLNLAMQTVVCRKRR